MPVEPGLADCPYFSAPHGKVLPVHGNLPAVQKQGKALVDFVPMVASDKVLGVCLQHRALPLGLGVQRIEYQVLFIY